jgi:hypothetical protein
LPASRPSTAQAYNPVFNRILRFLTIMTLRTLRTPLILGALAALSGCVVPPPSRPTITALPGPGKSFAQFQQDDAMCQNYAATHDGNQTEQAQAAGNNATATAVGGTLIGAAAGAVLGSLSHNAGAGAAVGGLTGLAVGGSLAANQAQAAGYSLQGAYDTSYAQCMVGNGETVQPPAYPVAGYYAPEPYYYAPGVVVIGGYGWGGYYRPGYWGGPVRGYYGDYHHDGYRGGDYHGGYHGAPNYHGGGNFHGGGDFHH